MDLTTSPRSPLSHDSDTDTTEIPLQTHLNKALSLTNGSAFKPHHHYLPYMPPILPPPQQHHHQVGASYKECLKNHAASLGGLALDGCGEFIPRHSTTTPFDPTTSFTCDACGCHRNFHRRVEPTATGTNEPPAAVPPPPPLLHWTTSPSPESTSPGPASPTPPCFHSSPASRALLALATGPSLPSDPTHLAQHHPSLNPPGRKRSRTKFTPEQKQRMYGFAEKMGWRLHRGGTNEKAMVEFCSEVGVNRGVFKVWMHNNRHRILKGTGNIPPHGNNTNIVVKNEVLDDEGRVDTYFESKSSPSYGIGGAAAVVASLQQSKVSRVQSKMGTQKAVVDSGECRVAVREDPSIDGGVGLVAVVGCGERDLSASSLGFDLCFNAHGERMVRVSVLNDALKCMYNAEKRGKRQALIRPSSKVIIKFLLVMQKHGYIGEFEYVDDHRAGKIVVELNGRLNKCGVISPRFDVGVKEIEGWTARLLPSRQVARSASLVTYSCPLMLFLLPCLQFGYIVLTTSAGIMDHEEARRKNVGGKVLGFFY
ncbi:hypothetical protein Tsubulata_049698 [Turnera subulata]|uniref:ZF-HD dimerization-type domain-containing protein n=1 Tax=Turnera subulata TaxID=218843 RepID=A0A9Q0FYN7_9ROSI|nr:hypothetical protein Tsubulata_049698 [Turnera subulata]